MGEGGGPQLGKVGGGISDIERENKMALFRATRMLTGTG
jgi:hypothetical protein